MHAFDVIEQLASATSRVRKEQIILDAYSHNCGEFFEAVQLAADPFIHFGVRKIAEIIEDDGDPGSLTFAQFRHLCEELRSQHLTGDVARAAINAAAEQCHANTWNQLYRRVLLKDLRTVDVTMINRILKRIGSAAKTLQIPVFRCQTATHSSIKPDSGQYLVDTEITGQRTIVLLDNFVWSFDSVGKSRDLSDATLRPLRSLASHLPASMILDGVLTGQGEYYLFDIIPMEDFRARYSAKTQRQRRDILEALQVSGVFSDSPVRVSPQVDVDLDTDAGKQLFNEYARQAIERGFHGLVLKKPDAPYQAKQSRAWVSWQISFT